VNEKLLSKKLDAYIANAPKEAQSKLRQIRAAIKSATLKTEEKNNEEKKK